MTVPGQFGKKVKTPHDLPATAGQFGKKPKNVAVPPKPEIVDEEEIETFEEDSGITEAVEEVETEKVEKEIEEKEAEEEVAEEEKEEAEEKKEEEEEESEEEEK